MNFPVEILMLLALCGSSLGLFEYLERISRDPLRAKIQKPFGKASWYELIISLPESFVHLFDTVFGERQFSLVRVERSFIASMIALIILYSILIFGLSSSSFRLDFIEGDLSQTGLFALSAGIALFVNFAADYLSLAETRYVISVLSKRMRSDRPLVKSIAFIVIFFALDALFTFTIFAGTLIFVLFLIALPSALTEGISTPIQQMWQLFLVSIESWLYFIPHFSDSINNTNLGAFQYAFSPCFWSTFITSIWLWIFALTSVSTRLVLPLIAHVDSLKKYFDIEGRPFRTLGIISVPVLFILAVFWELVSWIAL